MVFGIILGILINLIFISSILITLYTKSPDYQLLFYSSIGFVVFLISFMVYKLKYNSILKIPSYKSFLISRKKLALWVFWSFNIWALLSWFSMALIGTFVGFGWSFPNSPFQTVLTSEPGLTRLAGVICWIVHCSLIGLIGVGYKKARKAFRLALLKFRSRRARLEEFREKAEEEVRKEELKGV